MAAIFRRRAGRRNRGARPAACYGRGMATIPAALAALPILDERGAELRLDRLWHERTALIALVRHFG